MLRLRLQHNGRLSLRWNGLWLRSGLWLLLLLLLLPHVLELHGLLVL